MAWQKTIEYLKIKFDYVITNAVNDTLSIKISKIYHFLSALDCLQLKYPKEKEMIDLLLSLEYDNNRNVFIKNQCTDFDYAYSLINYSYQTSYRYDDIHKMINNIAFQRVYEWNYSDDFFSDFSTSSASRVK